MYTQPDQTVEHKNLTTRLKGIYRSYRDSQKKRGRKKKEMLRSNNRIAFYSSFIKKGDLCFDVGANVGNRTDTFLKIGAKVVAVEPQPDCIDTLNSQFGKVDNVTIVPKAVDASPGHSCINVGSSSTLSTMSDEWIDSMKKSGRFDGHDWDKKIKVETTTLDLLIEKYGIPRFCKIDVEGFEYNVLQGLTKPVGFISLEFAPEFVETTVKCVNYLHSLGMDRFNYSSGETMSFTLPKWIGEEEMVKMLRDMPKDTNIFGDIYAVCRDVSDL